MNPRLTAYWGPRGGCCSVTLGVGDGFRCLGPVCPKALSPELCALLASLALALVWPVGWHCSCLRLERCWLAAHCGEYRWLQCIHQGPVLKLLGVEANWGLTEVSVGLKLGGWLAHC